MKWFLLFSFLFISSLVVAQDDPYQYYDDGGISQRKNKVYTDVVFMFKPYYKIGFEHRFTKSFAMTGGMIFLNKNAEYKIPVSGFAISEDAVYEVGDSKFNIFALITYDFDIDKPRRRRSLSIGYNLVHLDVVTLHDFYISHSFFDYEMDCGLSFSLNGQVGLRMSRGDYTEDDYFYFGRSVSFTTVYLHAPITVGFKF